MECSRIVLDGIRWTVSDDKQVTKENYVHR